MQPLSPVQGAAESFKRDVLDLAVLTVTVSNVVVLGVTMLDFAVLAVTVLDFSLACDSVSQSCA